MMWLSGMSQIFVINKSYNKLKLAYVCIQVYPVNEKKGVQWEVVTSQSDLIVNSYLGRSWWVVTSEAYNLLVKVLSLP